MRQEVKQENDADLQTGIKTGKSHVEVINLEEDED